MLEFKMNILSISMCVAFLLTLMDTCHSRNWTTYFLMWFHQWLLLIYLVCYPIARIREYCMGKPFPLPCPIIYDILMVTSMTYLSYQNVDTTTQTCVISKYTNTDCKRPESDLMQDPMYYIGLKRNPHRFSKTMNTINMFLLIFSCMSMVERVLKKR